MIGSFFNNKLSRYDVHLKTIDGVNQQTVFGAILTIISSIIIFLLIISEIRLYGTKEIVSRMITDTFQSKESVKIILDIEFPKLPCDKLNYFQEVTRGTLHFNDSGQNVMKSPLLIDGNMTNPSSCRIFTELITDKVAGTIKITFDHPNVPDDFNEIPFEIPDLTHKINTISFLPRSSIKSKVMKNQKMYEVPGVNHNPLKGQTSVGLGIGIHQYSMQIVPTQYFYLNQEASTAHQYSVTERQVKLEHALRGIVLSGQGFKGFVGILITYDFYPVRLVLEERQDSIFEFLSNLCAIVGGVLTVLMLIEKCLHGSTKALIGKKD